MLNVEEKRSEKIAQTDQPQKTKEKEKE